jgi:hypothetical protein
MIQTIITSIINPNAAVNALQDLVRSSGIYGTFHAIGMALLALFAMLELYRIWLGGGERDLVWLAAKIAILSYLLSGTPAPLEVLVKTAYGYFATLGQAIAATGGGQQYQDLVTMLNTIAAKSAPEGPWWQQLGTIGQTFLNVLVMGAIFLLFLIVFIAVLAIYVFAVLASRVFVLLSILLAPLLLPLSLWRPMVGDFLFRWVRTTLHAFFLPVIGAVTLVVALRLGLVSPLEAWTDCVAKAAGAPYQCIGQQMASFVSAILGGLVAVFLMLSVDGVVQSFLGAAEVTAAGLIAARWAAGAPKRIQTIVQGGGGARYEATGATQQISAGGGSRGAGHSPAPQA